MTLGTRCRAFVLGAVLITLPDAALAQAGTDLGTLGGPSAGAEQINVWGAVTGSSQTQLGIYRVFLIPAPGEPMVPLGPDDTFSSGLGINDLSDVVFESGRAYLQRGSTIRELGYGLPHDVNNVGQAAGWTYFTPGEIHAVVWDWFGAARDLGVAGQQSFATAINDRGQVVGWMNDADGVAHAVRWEPDGSVTHLGTLGGAYSQAMAINEAGDVVGMSETSWQSAHAFLWKDDLATMVDLDTGRNFSMAFGINDVGQIVGERWEEGISSSHNAFVWTAPTGMMRLTTTVVVNGSGRATSINDLGEAVGSVADAVQSRAMLWVVPPPLDQQFAAMRRLTALLSADGVVNRGAAQAFLAHVTAAERAASAGRPHASARHLRLGADRLSRADAGSAQGRIIHVTAFAQRLAERMPR